MKLFLYYAFCSVKNQIRKLFKTWVAVLIAVCFVFGIVLGLGAAMLEDLAEGEMPSEEEEIPEEELFPEEEWTEEDTALAMQIAELVTGGIVLLVFAFNAISADKSGCAVFLQADVNLLFSSPMKPQSVLLFRLMTQIGTSLVISIYLLFQVPNMVLNFGISPWGAVAIMFAWGLLLILSKLTQVLLYAVASTYPSVKKCIRPVTFSILGLIVAGFVLYWKSTNITPFEAALRFFNAPATRWIPIWGWLKGFCMFALEGNLPLALLSLGLLIASAVALVCLIWTIRVDFYEDAMAKSEETAELQQAVQSGQTMVAKKKKDRSEKLRRDGMRHGFGANVYFFKAMYNRFRFAHLGIFTKTALTYLAIGLGGVYVLRFLMEIADFTPIALILAAVAFFRSLGNPLSQDTQMDSFLMIPESPWTKMIFSLLGGSTNCALDLLPAMLISSLIMGTNPLAALAWLLFIVTLDFYSTTVATFIDLSIPVSVSKNVKAVIQIMFIYFGLLPDIAILVVGGIFSALPIAAVVAAIVNVAVGAIFFALSPLFLENGRK